MLFSEGGGIAEAEDAAHFLVRLDDDGALFAFLFIRHDAEVRVGRIGIGEDLRLDDIGRLRP